MKDIQTTNNLKRIPTFYIKDNQWVREDIDINDERLGKESGNGAEWNCAEHPDAKDFKLKHIYSDADDL